MTGANIGLPDVDALNPARSIDPAPCGYFLTEALYSGPLPGGTAGLRLGIHGIAQETRPTGHIVRMAQPLRGLIPTVLDSAAVDTRADRRRWSALRVPVRDRGSAQLRHGRGRRNPDSCAADDREHGA